MKEYENNLQNLMEYTDFIRQLSAARADPAREENHAETLRAGGKARLLEILNREDACAERLSLTMPWLCSLFHLNLWERFLVAVALAFEIDGGLRAEYRSSFGTSVPDLHYGFLLLELIEPLSDTVFSCILPENPLSRFLLRTGKTEGQLMTRPLLLTETAARFLTTRSVGEVPFRRCLSPGAEPLLSLYPELETRLLSCTKPEDPRGFCPRGQKLAVVCGRPGSGRRSLVRRVADRLQRPCVMVRTNSLCSLEADSLYDALRDIACTAMLSGGFVCIAPVPEGREDVLYRLLEALDGSVSVVFLISGETDPLPQGTEYSIERFLLPESSGTREREDIWRHFAEKAGGFSFDPAGFAGRFHFDPETVRDVTESASQRARAQGRGAESRDLLAAACDHFSSGDFTIERNPARTLDDLILPPQAREQLELACLFAERQSELWDGWGFGKRFSYGRSIVVLMHGESGTGKTMAAGAVASRLHMPLLRADLSRIMDKYIGETEKRLDAVFTAARQNGCVLFFDEADSLFGKRTGVESSHDKYANLSTSYLLQRLEHYDNVVLLSTNLIRNFDSAFLRRIRYVVKFPMPDRSLRGELWRRAFPGGDLLRGEIDFALLAEADLSPARIQAAALSSALFAMREGESTVSMQNLAAALRLELEKTGKIPPAGLQNYLPPAGPAREQP